MRKCLVHPCRIYQTIISIVTIFAVTIGNSSGQSIPLELPDGVLVHKLTYVDSTQFFVGEAVVGDSLRTILVFAPLVDGARMHAAQSPETDREVQPKDADPDSTFSNRSVPVHRTGADGRMYYYVAHPGEGVSYTVEGNEVFVPHDILNQSTGLYWSATGKTPTISSLGANEFGEIAFQIAGTISRYWLAFTAFVIGLSIFVVILCIWLYKVRRENFLARKTRKKMIHAREEERKHLASELHDGPIQELHYVLRTIASGGQIEDDVVSTAVDSVSEKLREICSDLRPETLIHFGLPSAVQNVVDEFSARFPGISANAEIVVSERVLGYENDLAFYRVLQESLHNISKHSGATAVMVKLLIDEDWAELIVSDNGQGFEVPRRITTLVENGNLGLVGMMQRAHSINAAFDVQSSAKGTTVRMVARATKAESSRTLFSLKGARQSATE